MVSIFKCFKTFLAVLITVSIVLMLNDTVLMAQSNNYNSSSKGERETINVYKVASPAVVKIKTMSGAGAGCIIDPSGIVVTNRHVIGYTNAVNICITEDTCYSGSLIDVDNDDLALLKINANRSFPYLKLGDSSKIEVGQNVLAIGNPFGLDKTLTTGIVSRIDYKLNRIQTDASINPGNSGGPLLNTQAELIGINQAIVNPSGRSSAGIGFAIPSNTVKRLLILSKNTKQSQNLSGYSIPTKKNAIADNTPIAYQNTTFLGIAGKNMPDGSVVITGIAKGSPADKAGLLFKDIILSIDSVKVKYFDDIGFAIKDKKPGNSVHLIYMRNGQICNTSAILVPRD